MVSTDLLFHPQELCILFGATWIPEMLRDTVGFATAVIQWGFPVT